MPIAPSTPKSRATSSKAQPKKKRQPSIFTVRNKLSAEVRETGAASYEDVSKDELFEDPDADVPGHNHDHDHDHDH